MGRLSVLVVDDDSADRKLVRRLLANTGLDMEILEADSGTQARALDPVRLDAVFLDQNLPDEDGIGLLQMFRARWPRAAVMLMTGQGSEDLAKSAIIMGAVDYVAKRSLSANVMARMLQTGVTTARMREKLDEQQRELATFSDTLVHDLRAPIRSVEFLAGQVGEDLDAGDEEGMRQALRMMQTSVVQMKELLDGLADYLRHDREMQMSDCDLQTVLARSLAALDLEIKESGSMVDSGEVSGSILCRPEQIAQLFQNLIANAIKYSGTVSPRITISARPEGDALLCSVADNGVGIPERYRQRVFEPFKRGVDHNAPHGTGLGLSTCRKIVRRHGGDIWCEENDGGGTRMVFRLARTPLSDDIVELGPGAQAGAA